MPATRSRLARRLAWVLAAVSCVALPARGVILLNTGDPAVNTTAPTGALAGSGWQHVGAFGPFIGTPVGPKYFATAAHCGFAGGTLFFQGTHYPVARDPATNEPLRYQAPGSDLILYQITGTFPSWAPLWTRPGAEVGRPLVVIGRGTQRGAEVRAGADGHLCGWGWGDYDQVTRWGENKVVAVPRDPDVGAVLHATFDADGGVNEGTLSDHDSGGAVFIRDDADGAWKLAGINYSVDGPFYARDTPDTAENPNPAFNASLFNTTGLFQRERNGTYVPVSGPAGFYATQVADHLAFINVVLRNTPLARIGNDVFFGFASVARTRYRVERCDDLVAGPWSPLADNVAGNGGTVLVADPGAAGRAQRFYRAVPMPAP